MDVPNDTTNRRLFRLYNSNTTDITNCLKIVNVVDKISTTYVVFGEHNKPIGTYTGNGSATSRTIDTGGTGRVLVIMQNSIFTIVTRMGALGVDANLENKSTTIFHYNEVYYKDGILTISSSNELINKSNIEYTYQVL